MGIMSYDAKTKIIPDYENIKQIDKDRELYLVTNNKKQGVINSNGSIIVYLEYDQIGIDSTRFASDNIKNQYLLYNKCIPAKRNGVWDLFDYNGKKITKESYDDLGCAIGSGNKDERNANNVLLIPKHEGIVVRKNDLYGIIDSDGNSLVPIALQSVYSTTSEGEESYSMIYNNEKMDVIKYIDYIKAERSKQEQQNNNNTNNNTQQQTNTNSTTETNNQNITEQPNSGEQNTQQ